MPYTTPPTFVSGGTVTASNLNILSDDIEYLYGISQGVTFSGAQISRSTNQSISDSTDTNISWNAESFDYGGWWSSGTALTVPAGAIPAGYTNIAVLAIARAKFASNTTGNRKLTVLKNGSEVGSTALGGVGGGDTTLVWLVELFTVAAADTVAVQVYQTSGGALNVTAASISLVRYAPAS